MDDDKKPRTDKEILEEARERLKWCIDTNSDERKKQKDDLRFATLDQWDSAIRASRENDVNGPRPCLTIEKSQQYINQVVNDFRQNPVSGKIRPVSDDANEESAEVFQGIVRNIENHSLAHVAYVAAGDSAVTTGEGYFRVLTEFKTERSRKQKIVVKLIKDMFSCYLGPHAMPDGSDSEYGFILEDNPKDKFKREFPKASTTPEDLAELEDYAEYWGEKDSVRVAEYFYFTYEPTKILYLSDGRDLTQKEYDALPEPRPATVGERMAQLKTTKWCKLTGLEVLEKRDWAGKYIPIIKVLGKEKWVDGKRTCWGLVRPAKDSLRMYNYWASSLTEKLALSPKAPFIGFKGQFTDPKWKKANVENYAFLEADAVEVNGVTAPLPKRQEPTQIESGLMSMFPLIEHDVQTSLGMFKAALGQEQPQQSGKAILALTRESDTGTYHFAANMGISVCYVTRIIIDLIPKVMDTEDIMQILGEDGKLSSIKIDRKQPEALKKVQDELGNIKRIFNPNVGEYGVTVTTGPSYNTRRMENAALFTDLANSAKDPGSAATLHYLAIKNADLEGGGQAADMLEAQLPPSVQQVLNKDAPPVPAAVRDRIAKLEQALQIAHQENEELKSGVKETEIKVAAHKDEAIAKLNVNKEVHEKEMELERAKASDAHQLEIKKANDSKEATIAKARIDAEAKIVVAQIGAGSDLSGELIKAESAADEGLAKDLNAPETPIAQLTKAHGAQTDALKGIADMLGEHMTLNRAVLEAHAKPKQITLVRGPDGRPTGGMVQ